MPKRLTPLLLILAPALGGCVIAAAGAGAGGALYVTGDLEAEFPQEPAEVAAAAEDALAALGLPIVSSTVTSLDAVVTSRNADDKKITVKIDGRDAGGSRVSIRVGTFGDETQSRRILREIESRLQ